MISLLEYVERNRRYTLLNEAVRNKDMGRALDLITKYLQKKLEHIIMIPTPEFFEENGEQLIGYRWINCKTGANVRIGWSSPNIGSSAAYCVDFFKDAAQLLAADGRGKTDLSVYTNGASLVLVIPLIVEIMSTGTYDASSALVRKLNQATMTESVQFYLGNLRYTIVREDAQQLKTELFKKKKSLQSQKSNKSAIGDYDAVAQLEADIQRINDALSSEDEVEMNETLLSFKKNVPTFTQVPQGTEGAQKQIQTAAQKFSDPKTAFKMMEKYLVLALAGDRNIVLICGAPGVGKTFRVSKFLSEITSPILNRQMIWAKDVDFINGDIHLVKGKCSGPALYRMLWRSKEEGKVLLIDDADSIIDDPNSVNLLKAAGDGGKDRVVTWAIAGKIKDLDPDDPEGNQIELPKQFKYNGKIIILTNYAVGMVDTAIRSRAYIQNINFTVQSVLEIIKDVMPTMKGQGITEEGKQAAYDFLCQLAEEGTQMEISMRTFGTCAGIFSVFGTSGDDEDRKLVMEMIKEQMELQSERGGKKY